MRKITKDDVLWYLVQAECRIRDLDRLRPERFAPTTEAFARAYALVRVQGPEFVEVAEEESGG